MNTNPPMQYSQSTVKTTGIGMAPHSIQVINNESSTASMMLNSDGTLVFYKLESDTSTLLQKTLGFSTTLATDSTQQAIKDLLTSFINTSNYDGEIGNLKAANVVTNNTSNPVVLNSIKLNVKAGAMNQVPLTKPTILQPGQRLVIVAGNGVDFVVTQADTGCPIHYFSASDDLAQNVDINDNQLRQMAAAVKFLQAISTNPKKTLTKNFISLLSARESSTSIGQQVDNFLLSNNYNCNFAQLSTYVAFTRTALPAWAGKYYLYDNKTKICLGEMVIPTDSKNGSFGDQTLADVEFAPSIQSADLKINQLTASVNSADITLSFGWAPPQQGISNSIYHRCSGMITSNTGVIQVSGYSKKVALPDNDGTLNDVLEWGFITSNIISLAWDINRLLKPQVKVTHQSMMN